VQMTFSSLRPDARAHAGIGALRTRDGEPRSVNATRRERSGMLLVRYDQ